MRMGVGSNWARRLISPVQIDRQSNSFVDRKVTCDNRGLGFRLQHYRFPENDSVNGTVTPVNCSKVPEMEPQITREKLNY
jgi:hypothetical protein